MLKVENVASFSAGFMSDQLFYCRRARRPRPVSGIFLTQRHWQAEDIGLLMSVGGIAGLLATLPAGFITDSSRHKRLLLAGVCLVITLTTLLLWFSQKTSVVALSQVASGICAAFVGPLIAGITLGLARQARL